MSAQHLEYENYKINQGIPDGAIANLITDFKEDTKSFETTWTNWNKQGNLNKLENKLIDLFPRFICKQKHEI